MSLLASNPAYTSETGYCRPPPAAKVWPSLLREKVVVLGVVL